MTDDVLFGYRLQLFDLSGRTSVATRSGLRSSNESARPRPECNRPATAPVAQAGPMNRPRARRGRPPRPTRVGILALTLALVIPLAVIASGCGGSSGANLAQKPSDASDDPNAYSACMRKHGVGNSPDPDSNNVLRMEGVDRNSPTFQAAAHACASLAPTPAPPAQQAQEQAQMLAFAKCMRSHGVPKFPDPQTVNGVPQVSTGQLDPNSPIVKAAIVACRSKFVGAQKLVQGLTHTPQQLTGGAGVAGVAEVSDAARPFLN
jgi:hypothetical protein